MTWTLSGKGLTDAARAASIQSVTVDAAHEALFALGDDEGIEDEVLVVAARTAWPLYVSIPAYLCQTTRSFRPVKRMGFYTNGQIQRAFPRILAWLDNMPLEPPATAQLLLDVDPDRQAAGRALRRALEFGWEFDQAAKVALLTAEDDPMTLILPNAVPHREPVAWCMGTRYARLGSLLSASSTEDLA